MNLIPRRLASLTLVLLVTASTARGQYIQTNLVTDNQSLAAAQRTDPNLRGAWGLSYSTTSPFWVSDQAASFTPNVPNAVASGATSIYSVNDNVSHPTASFSGFTVAIPNVGNAPPDNLQDNGPTGQVNTSAPGISITANTDFVLSNGHSAAFIFANLDGSISAWNGGAAAQITPTMNTGPAGASYTGLAIGNGTNGPLLFAANQNSGQIDVFKSDWSFSKSITDPNAANFPAGFGAFNVQNLDLHGTQTIFATFVNQDGSGGIVDEFNTNGTFIKTLISDTAGTHLEAPWGLAIAPTDWGKFSGDLLVANNNPNSDNLTEINAYNPDTGAWVGTLTLDNGQIFSVDELWAISFGNGKSAGSSHTLFFTAGLTDNTDGLFGSLSVPEPSSVVLGIIAMGFGMARWAWRNRRRPVTA